MCDCTDKRRFNVSDVTRHNGCCNHVGRSPSSWMTYFDTHCKRDCEPKEERKNECCEKCVDWNFTYQSTDLYTKAPTQSNPSDQAASYTVSIADFIDKLVGYISTNLRMDMCSKQNFIKSVLTLPIPVEYVEKGDAPVFEIKAYIIQFKVCMHALSTRWNMYVQPALTKQCIHQNEIKNQRKNMFAFIRDHLPVFIYAGATGQGTAVSPINTNNDAPYYVGGPPPIYGDTTNGTLIKYINTTFIN
jgi:hypothetical protein